MVNVSEYALGNFLKPEDIKKIKEDPTAEITEEGIINEDTPFGREILEIPLKLSNGVEKIYGMNKTSCGNLMEAYGEDTSSWKGKKIRFELLKQNVRGQMKEVIYAYPKA